MGAEISWSTVEIKSNYCDQIPLTCMQRQQRQYAYLVSCCRQSMSHFHTCVFNSCWSATAWNSCFWHACSATNNSDRNAMTKSLMPKWCYWAEVLKSKMPICVSSLLLQIIHVSFPLFRLQRVLKWVGQPLRWRATIVVKFLWHACSVTNASMRL